MTKKTCDFRITNGKLNVGSLPIGDQGAELICSLDTLSIRHVLLGFNNITAIGIAALSFAKWENLEDLILSANKIGNQGCKYLSRMSLNNLKHLSLNANNIGSVGIVHLSKAQPIQLQQIWLAFNPLAIDAMKQLVKANWKSLRLLELSNTSTSFTQAINCVLHANMVYINLTTANYQDEYLLIGYTERQKLKRLMKEKMPKCIFR